tara:strand:+ start:13289 stop:13588 length:300 start_codon:yes stop_codon:yes gene_type:complete
VQFKHYDKLDIRVGDIIKINGDDVYSSVHIVVRPFYRAFGDKGLFAVEAYTILCDEPYYEDDMRVGEICPLYLTEFLERAEENSLEVLHRHLHPINIKP